MRPSQTPQGATWVKQFDLDDQPVASALLDSIRFASYDEVLLGIRSQIETVIFDSALRVPVALFPVLAQEDLQLAGSKPSIAGSPAVYQDFDPRQVLPQNSGSEAIISHLIREVEKEFAASQVIAGDKSGKITVGTLRVNRVRTICLLTDYIGSGKQVVDYLDSWQRNKTIRSWLSFGWLRIVVIAFSSTASGQGLVEQHKACSELFVYEPSPELEGIAAWREEPAVIEICVNYARRNRLKASALGFANSGGLFASAFSVPNNLPAVLWDSSSSTWSPFFPGRTIPQAIASAIGSYVPSRDFAHELELAKEFKLSRRLVEGMINPRWERLIINLALVPAGIRAISRQTAQKTRETKAILKAMRHLGLTDHQGSRTPAGERALRRARMRPRKRTAGLSGSDEPYYPRFIR